MVKTLSNLLSEARFAPVDTRSRISPYMQSNSLDFYSCDNCDNCDSCDLCDGCDSGSGSDCYDSDCHSTE